MTNVSELKELPVEELKKYTARELRHAASYIDRDNGKHSVLNMISVFKKLKDLKAEVVIHSDETGYLTFNHGKNTVTRKFSSGSELSLALALGPVILEGYPLYLKLRGRNVKCEIVPDDENISNSAITVRVLKTNEYRLVHLNGAEKILCNTLSGLTLGQLVLKEFNQEVNT